MILLLFSLLAFGRVNGNNITFDVLSTLYTQTNGPAWTNKLNWMNFSESIYENKWDGVYCSGNKIVELNINQNNLVGSIPSELGILTDLTGISFQENSLSSAIPSQIGLLTSSVHLLLGTNLLKGSIPSELGFMTAITHGIEMDYNSLTGNVPSQLGLLTELTNYFKFNLNPFSASLPSQLFGLTKLKSHFLFGATNITGQIPSEIGIMSQLTQGINFGANQLSGPIPSQIGLLNNFKAGLNWDDNKFTSLIPSEMGQLISMTKAFYISSSMLSKTIPSQLALLSSITEEFSIEYNGLCGSLPSEVQTVGDANNWAMTQGNTFGTPCFDPSPSPSISSSPTSQPSSLPTVQCDSGTYSSDCIVCSVGQYSSSNTPPWSTNCTKCEIGYYTNSLGSSTCTKCATGKVSSNDRSTCLDCEPGQYSNRTECINCPIGTYAPLPQGSSGCFDCGAGSHTNNESGATTCTPCDTGTYSTGLTVQCSSCPLGRYSPSGQADCTDCDVGYYAPTNGSASCSICGVGYSSYVGSKSCDIAAVNYYLNHKDNDENEEDEDENVESLPCPDHSECLGGVYLPQPDKGYWVDRRRLKHAATIIRCPRNTCIGASTSNLSCWNANKMASFEEESEIEDGQGDDDDGISLISSSDESSCNICSKGATGPLCGSCEATYTYSTFKSDCVSCEKAWWKSLLFFIAVIILIIIVGLFYTGKLDFTKDNDNNGGVGDTFHHHHNPSLITRIFILFSKFDSGVFRVLWSSYQIIDSIAWNLNVVFPNPFSNFIDAFSFVSFNFAAVNCFSHANYLITVIVWTMGPIILALLNYFIYLFRVNRNQSMKDEYSRTHMFSFLLLSFLVLPPVTRVQFQGIDCVEIAGKNFLRVDTSIGCNAKSFHTFMLLDSLFIAIFVSIPFIWLILLYRKRSLMDPFVTNREKSLQMRVENRELKPILFLFEPYLPEFYFWEVFEMWRRIFFIGVLPLLTSSSAQGAAIGMLASLISLAAYREFEPFNYTSVNLLVYIAQYAILLTYGSALMIDTNLIHTSGFVFGVILILINLVIILLAIMFCLYRYYQEDVKYWKVLSSEEMEIINNALNKNGGKKRTISSRSSSRNSTNQLSQDRTFSYGGIELGSGNPSNNIKEGVEEDSDSKSLQQLTVNFKYIKIIKSIGSGNFGEVFQGTFRDEPVAIKTLRHVNERSVLDFRNEILLTSSLRHPNIVNFIGCCWQAELTCLLLEWIPKGTLAQLLAKKRYEKFQDMKTHHPHRGSGGQSGQSESRRQLSKHYSSPSLASFSHSSSHSQSFSISSSSLPLSPSTTTTSTMINWPDPLMKLITDIARGMAYLHNREYFDESRQTLMKCIIHRDLKPDNVLISEYTSAKLADFGIARAKDEFDLQMSVVGTPLFSAPELMRADVYDEKVDVYSFGLTLVEIASDGGLLAWLSDKWHDDFQSEIPDVDSVGFRNVLGRIWDNSWTPFSIDQNHQNHQNDDMANDDFQNYKSIFFDNHTPQFIDELIIKCCSFKPMNRPTFHEILDLLNDGNLELEKYSSPLSKHHSMSFSNHSIHSIHSNSNQRLITKRKSIPISEDMVINELEEQDGRNSDVVELFNNISIIENDEENEDDEGESDNHNNGVNTNHLLKKPTSGLNTMNKSDDDDEKDVNSQNIVSDNNEDDKTLLEKRKSEQLLRKSLQYRNSKTLSLQSSSSSSLSSSQHSNPLISKRSSNSGNEGDDQVVTSVTTEI